MGISLKKIIMWIFILRPIIDLFWSQNIIAGMNLAGITSALLLLIVIIYLIVKGKIIVSNFYPQYLFGIYVTIITIFYFIFYPSVGSLQNWLRVVSTLSILIILVPDLEEEEFEFMVKGYLLCTLIPITISFLQVAGIVEYTYWDYLDGAQVARASGGYRQPSHLTRYLVFGIMYALYFICRDNLPKKKRKHYWIYIVLAVIATIFSYHRTGYLCVLIVFVIYLFSRYRKDAARIIGIGVGCIIAGIAIMFLLDHLNVLSLDLSGFRTLLSFDNIMSVSSSGNTELNLRGRGNIIQKVFSSIGDSPFWIAIFGVGGEINRYSGITLSVADMDFLAILWHYGIVGILLWIIGIIRYIRNYISSKYYAIKNEYRMLVVMSIIVYIIFGFTIEVVFTPNFLFHIYLINGYLTKKMKVNNKITINT